jgi:ABC-type transport system substrate-binding protein
MVILAVFVLMVSAVSAADPEPQYGGTFVMTVPSIVHLDVQAINQISSNLWSQMYYETLFDVNDQGEVVPLLVESFDVSDDGLVYNFKLHEGIKFHDGTDFNAEVAKWNFDRKIEKQLPMWNDIPIDKIEVVDAYTLRFTLTQPYAPIFKTLAIKTFGMYSPAFVEKVGDEGLKNEACGTGPFVVDEYIPGEILKLKKNENYC